MQESDSDSESTPNTYFGLRVKQGISRLNILSLFLMSFIITLCIDDQLSWTQPLLQNKDYYNLSREDATSLSAKASQLTSIPSIIMAFVSGYLFDIFGRKITLFLATTLSGLAYVLYAVYSPNQQLYQLNAVYFSIMIAPFQASPLSTDYVRKESRGAAVGLAYMGLSLGTILSLSVLFEFTKGIDPVQALIYPSAIQVIFGISLLFILTEPKRKKLSISYCA